MFKYYKNEQRVGWNELFENLEDPPARDWRLSDELSMAEREAYQRKNFKTFEFEGDRYEVVWYEYIPLALDRLGYTKCFWEGAGWYRYQGDAEFPLYIDANRRQFKYASTDTIQQPIPLEICEAIIEFFRGLL